MKNRFAPVAAAVAAALSLVSSSPAAAQISLGTAQSFGALGGSTVTNTGATTVNGNVGVSPGSAVTGFPPGVLVGGALHLNDGVAQQAQLDLTTAYNNIATTPCTVDLTGQNLGGLTLTPGVYCFDTSAQLTGTLTLDGLGNPDALFLFKIGSTLTTASASAVSLINAGDGCDNAYWQVGTSATLGTGTSFAGDILALSSITLTTGASSTGRALARNGAVTLDTNVVNICGPGVVCPIITVNPATLPNGTVGTPYNQVITATGGTAPYVFAISAGSLPTGLVLNGATGAISGSPTTPGTFNFAIRATDANGCVGTRLYTVTIASPGCPAITLSPNTLPPGTANEFYSQSILASNGTAPYVYTITAGALPAGYTLNPGTGTISGITTQTGLFNFTVRATDAGACIGSMPYTLTVRLSDATSIPSLDPRALALLAALLAVAGSFIVKRFTA